MHDSIDPGDRAALADLITRSLAMADALGARRVGVLLNEALVALTGEGISPWPLS